MSNTPKFNSVLKNISLHLLCKLTSMIKMSKEVENHTYKEVTSIQRVNRDLQKYRESS